MPFQLAVHSTHILVTTIFVVCVTMRSNLVTAYVIKTQNSHVPSIYHRQHSSSFVSAALPSLPASALLTPTSSLASKVIFQSPAMENIYKEILVASKPLNIRKYTNPGKVKKSKKESKIYYIPIPAMPYRFIPGIGYDYQPMRINAIAQETSAFTPNGNVEAPAMNLKKKLNGFQKPAQQSSHQLDPSNDIKMNKINNNKKQSMTANSLTVDNSSSSSGEIQFIRLNRDDYYFNGRPFRLQVTHAQPKNHLTSQNLKTKLFFNKKIIY